MSSSFQKEDNSPTKIDEFIAETASCANLVDDKPTWELVEENSDNLEIIKRCCNAELETMEKCGLVSVPYYFYRVTIISRRKIIGKKYIIARITLRKLRLTICKMEPK